MTMLQKTTREMTMMQKTTCRRFAFGMEIVCPVLYLVTWKGLRPFSTSPESQIFYPIFWFPVFALAIFSSPKWMGFVFYGIFDIKRGMPSVYLFLGIETSNFFRSLWVLRHPRTLGDGERQERRPDEGFIYLGFLTSSR